MSQSQLTKRAAFAVFFCVMLVGLVVIAILVLSGPNGGGGVATAAPVIGALDLPPVGSSAGNAGNARKSPWAIRSNHSGLPVPVGQIDPIDLLSSLQPRLVSSFPLFQGYLTAVVIPVAELAPEDTTPGPVALILLGSAAAWTYTALTGGTFGGGDPTIDPPSIDPPTGGPTTNPPGGNTPPGANPPGNNPPGSNPPGANPPGNNPPGNNPPGNNPPGNNPPGNNPPGNNPPGNNPPGNNPPGNNPPGNNPPGNNPPGGPSDPGPVTPVDTAGQPPIPADTSANELPTSTVPEPVSTVLIGTGLAALAAFRRRRRD